MNRTKQDWWAIASHEDTARKTCVRMIAAEDTALLPPNRQCPGKCPTVGDRE